MLTGHDSVSKATQLFSLKVAMNSALYTALVQMLCWLLPSLLRHVNNRIMEGGGFFSYYSRYTYSSHSFGYSFSFNLKVLGVRAIVLGFRVRVRVRISIRGLGDQNYEVGFETVGTVTQNYANSDYSGYFSSSEWQEAT